MFYYKTEPPSFLLPVTKGKRYTYAHIFQFNFVEIVLLFPQQEYGFVHRDLSPGLGQLSYFCLTFFLYTVSNG